eukprot:CAMPEP_0115259906 /NCGR_PEP_ID=MMETSP0270-20121206/48064_1 /TAXON_ID=71861 /ORGANISM="Scrippsiella trochoidea, Strain CCMP3099" /LENGTH=232 /DNA_ID=CAMNT_0002675727 /DNA_START=197 /DNA_END=895 /DNA_ORIENTATION=+
MSSQMLVSPITASPPWRLGPHGFELIRLPLAGAADLALQAGAEMSLIANRWRAIKNGDESTGRRQSYLKMRGLPPAPISMNTASILEAARELSFDVLGPETSLNDCVVIADFEPDLPRQELHRDIRRDAAKSSTHGLLIPLSHGVCLHAVPGSHAPRTSLRGTFSRGEVVRVDVPPGWALLWDGMLVHAGDGAAPGTVAGQPNRPRMHAYPEMLGEPRPFDDQGDRGIIEID